METIKCECGKETVIISNVNTYIDQDTCKLSAKCRGCEQVFAKGLNGWQPVIAESEEDGELPEPKMGDLEKSIRNSLNMAGSKYIAEKLDKWGWMEKETYLRAYNNDEEDVVVDLTRDLGNSFTHQYRNSVRHMLGDVLQEQLEN